MRSSMLQFAASLLASGLVPLLAACTPSAANKSGDPPAVCTKAGDPCTFSPGKLGVCTEGTGGGATLVCQSLH
jgi:hypothetical protein